MIEQLCERINFYAGQHPELGWDGTDHPYCRVDGGTYYSNTMENACLFALESIISNRAFEMGQRSVA